MKKEFLKGLYFIMNSIKFKFNGKFYKQKFGTSIGSVISRILADIVMEDLEIIKLDNCKILSYWYRKSTYFGKVLNFISNHPFKNKVAIIKNLVDRAVCLTHEFD